MKSVIGILVFASLNAFAARQQAPAYYLPSNSDPKLSQVGLDSADCPHLKTKKIHTLLAANTPSTTKTQSRGGKGADQP